MSSQKINEIWFFFLEDCEKKPSPMLYFNWFKIFVNYSLLLRFLMIENNSRERYYRKAGGCSKALDDWILGNDKIPSIYTPNPTQPTPASQNFTIKRIWYFNSDNDYFFFSQKTTSLSSSLLHAHQICVFKITEQFSDKKFVFVHFFHKF